ncbi:MAG: alpha/beta hydrolase [Terriglobales bacterium]
MLRSAATIYLLVSLFGAGVLCEIAIHPPRRPIAAEDIHPEMVGAGYRASVQEHSIVAADGAHLFGSLVLPRRYNGDAVIILHGVSDNRLGAEGFAGDFLPEGYIVLLPDARAHGESGGKYATYGVIEKDDIRRWIDWLEVNTSPRCVYLLGESMGAATAIQATAADPRICATVAESPFETFREVAYERIGQMTNTGPWLGKTIARPMVELAFVFARLRTGVWLTDASPLRAIQHTHAPILLIHGAADTHIAPANSQALFNAARDHAELWIVPRAEHCGASSVQPEEFHRRVVGWFDSHRANSAAAGHASAQ